MLAECGDLRTVLAPLRKQLRVSWVGFGAAAAQTLRSLGNFEVANELATAVRKCKRKPMVNWSGVMRKLDRREDTRLNDHNHNSAIIYIAQAAAAQVEQASWGHAKSNGWTTAWREVCVMAQLCLATCYTCSSPQRPRLPIMCGHELMQQRRRT